MREADRSPCESREVVAIAPERIPPQPCYRVKHDVGFVTHLIAMHEQVPQLREKRRAGPEEATAAYAAAHERFKAQ